MESRATSKRRSKIVGDSPTLKALAEGLRAARKGRGWGTRRLFVETGVAESTIIDVESGYHNTTVVTLEKLAQALRIPVFALFLGKEVELFLAQGVPRFRADSPPDDC